MSTSLTATVRAAMAAAALVVAGTAAAQAQSAGPVAQMSPAPSASPAGSSSPGQSTTPGNTPPNAGGAQQVASRPAFTPFAPVIDIQPVFTQPAYYSTPAQIKGYDPLDVGGSVRIPITRRFNLVFDRLVEGTLNQPLGCILQPAEPGARATEACPADSRDVILQYHATYAITRNLTADLGDSFRHREWNSNASGVSSVPYNCNNNGQSTGSNCTTSSTEHHYAYLGFTYQTTPMRDFFNSSFAFNITGDAQNVDHHVAIQCTAANQRFLPGVAAQCGTAPTTYIVYYDENPSLNRNYETTQGVTWILPINHGTSIVTNERWGALNFYENPTLIGPFGTTVGEPYRWTSALAITVNKRFSPGFTLGLRHQDYHGVTTQQTPFVSPNALHVGSWDVIGTFHVDTGSWFH